VTSFEHCLLCRATVSPAAQPLAPAAQPATSSAAKALNPALRQLGALLDTLEHLLTAPFPVPVAAPAGGILSLAARLLDLDDSAGVKENEKE